MVSPLVRSFFFSGGASGALVGWRRRSSLCGVRAGYPNSKNHAFLKKLRLKTIIYLCPEDYMVCFGAVAMRRGALAAAALVVLLLAARLLTLVYPRGCGGA